MEPRPNYAVKQPGYAVLCCGQCERRQRVDIGEDPEGWVKMTTVRGKMIKVLCPMCAGEMGGAE